MTNSKLPTYDRLLEALITTVVDNLCIFGTAGTEDALFPDDPDASAQAWRVEFQAKKNYQTYTLTWDEDNCVAKVYEGHPVNDERADEDFVPVWELQQTCSPLEALVLFLMDYRNSRVK